MWEGAGTNTLGCGLGWCTEQRQRHRAVVVMPPQLHSPSVLLLGTDHETLPEVLHFHVQAAVIATRFYPGFATYS